MSSVAMKEIPEGKHWDEIAAEFVYQYQPGDIIVAPTPAIKSACINGLRALGRVKEEFIDVRLKGQEHERDPERDA